MRDLLRLYYNNKYKIWGIIIFIVLVLLIIQLLNSLVASNNDNKVNNILKTTTDGNVGTSINDNTSSNTSNNQDKVTQVTTNQSVVDSTTVNSSTLQQINNLVEKFFSYCNDGNLEEAYNLLSNECKKEQYPNLESFKTLYYDSVFDSGIKKTATIENWILNTYRVNIIDDMLSTGNVNQIKKLDYMTIVKEENVFKLNINSFVGTEKINKKANINNIIFNVVSKNVYMDYEEYNIEVENKTGYRVLLDSQKDPKSIYLQDTNEMKYYSYSSELLTSLLRVNNGFSTQLKVKFSKTYSSSSKRINSINLSDVILNYQSTNEEKKKITINI